LARPALALEYLGASSRLRVAICSTGVGNLCCGGARSREAAMASILIGKQAVASRLSILMRYSVECRSDVNNR
jgi:hypothetical protein